MSQGRRPLAAVGRSTAREEQGRDQMFTRPTPTSITVRDKDDAVERELLPSLPIFAGLPEAELDAVAEAIWTIELEQGDPVATEGDFQPFRLLGPLRQLDAVAERVAAHEPRSPHDLDRFGNVDAGLLEPPAELVEARIQP